MVATLARRPVHRLILACLLVILAALLVLPRAAGQGTRTVAVDVVLVESSFNVIRAPANQQAPAEAFLLRGDVFSGQGAVYRQGQAGGERIGSFYFLGVGTADARTEQEFAAAGNHFYATARIEHFGQGSLDLAGTVNFAGRPSYLSVVGGTGSYFGAAGQCHEEAIENPQGDDIERFTCDLR